MRCSSFVPQNTSFYSHPLERFYSNTVFQFFLSPNFYLLISFFRFFLLISILPFFRILSIDFLFYAYVSFFVSIPINQLYNYFFILCFLVVFQSMFHFLLLFQSLFMLCFLFCEILNNFASILIIDIFKSPQSGIVISLVWGRSLEGVVIITPAQANSLFYFYFFIYIQAQIHT